MSPFLLSGDADFVPVVASLRRRGKIVIGAGFANPSSALVRECYDYVDLSTTFVCDDFVAFQIFRKGGLLEKWLADEVRVHAGDATRVEPIKLSFEWQQSASDIIMRSHQLDTIADVLSHGNPYYRIYLTSEGPLDVTDRTASIREFEAKYPKYIDETKISRGRCLLVISPVAWQGIWRRLDQVVGAYEALQKWEAHGSGVGYTLSYHRNNDTGQYEVN